MIGGVFEATGDETLFSASLLAPRLCRWLVYGSK